MKKPMGHTSKDQKGFTLIELVVVIAILGVMAAIAVPMVNNFLTSSKEQAYIADRETIQAAVSGFYSSPGNARFEGRRQYPIIGTNKTDLTLLLKEGDTANYPTPLTVDGNPLGGTKGGTPKWLDDVNNPNGVRDNNENLLNDETVPTEKGWHVTSEDKGSFTYLVDTRDYLIDFDLLVTAGFLDKNPGSASTDNTGGSDTGSYSWFVDVNGRVQSLLFFYPVSDTPEDTNYQEVYP